VETVVALDGRALAFTAAIAIVTGVFFGLAPALRGTAVPAGDALTRNRTAGQTRATAVVHRGLLVAEVALAVVLVIGAMALTTSFVRLIRVDPGFDAAEVLTMRLTLPSGRYATGEAAARFFDAAVEEFRRVPGVEHAAAVTSLPLGGWLYGTTFAIHGAPSQPERPPSAHLQHAGENYPEALGLSLAGGRWFTAADTARSPRVAVVNETFVSRYVPDGVAVGRQLRLGITAREDAAQLWEIVGVVRDVKTGSLADAALATPEIYVPYRQSPQWSMFLAVRAGAGNPARLLPALRAVVRGLDPELPIGALATMDERLGTSVQRERFRTMLVSSSAALALLLSCLGVYAIRSQAITARIREMGVRLAVGATPGHIRSMVLTQGMWQVLVGIGAGLVLFAWLSRLLEPWLFATEAMDPRVLTAASALFAAAALAASWIPARRAARVDPLVLLRDE
jgi:putative ABC transport system permease protein